METITASNPNATPKARARNFALVGIIVAFLGLAGAVFGPLAFEVQRPPPKELSDVLADTAVKIKERIAKTEVAPASPPQTDWRVMVIIIASALGFIGAAFGTASWIRREDLRLSGAAVAIGVTAIAFHYIMAAVGVAIVCIILGRVLSHFS